MRWTKEDDQVLLECVQNAVSQGKSVYAGIGDASEKLNRSRYACHFRYYKKHKKAELIKSGEEKQLSARDIYEYIRSLEQKLQEKERELAEIKQEHEMLLAVIEKARKHVFLGEEAVQKPKFIMEKNGNLVRIS